MEKIGLIFDMDGVVVDNDRFHCQSWIKFSENYGFTVSYEEVKSWFGNINSEILKNLFDRTLSKEEIKLMSFEKEKLYREIYDQEIVELAGLSNFLQSLENENICIALATSAPAENVKFVLNKTGLSHYFPIITDESEITRGKPDPEIFLITAEKLGLRAESCLVFEDSHHGIDAARAAGMKVVGVATSHKAEALKGTEFNITDFKTLRMDRIESIFNNQIEGKL